MGAFDIVMRNAGPAFDIDDGTASSATMPGEGFMEVATTTADVASYKVETVLAISDTAQVASYKFEAVLAISDAAQVASLKLEPILAISDSVQVSSYKAEVVHSREEDIYAPYDPGGGSSVGLCVSFASSARFANQSGACCDGFVSLPPSSGGDPELLAFQKAVDDTVLLCTRGLSGLFPTAALSVMSWSRLETLDTAGQVPIVNGADAADGWRLVYGGSGAPSTALVQYRDTGAALRSDSHTFSGGTLVGAGWHAIGGFRAGENPWLQRAWVDDEVAAGTTGTVAPQTGTRDAITLFGEPDGPQRFRGQIICPLFFAVDLGSDGTATYQDSFFDDLGQRQSAIYSNPNLLLAPRALSTVAAGDEVRVWAVDSDDVEISGPTVMGTPAYWRGPWWGLAFEDIHWVQVPWASSSLAAGKTLLLSLQGSAVPGTDRYVAGRLAGGAGGIELLIRSTDGVDARAVLYDAAGGAVLTLNLALTATLGDLIHYVVRVGVAGTAQCELTAFDEGGTSIGTTTGTPSAAVALNQDQRWGRAHAAGSPYNAGTCFRWVEFGTILTTQQVQDYIAQTGSPPSPTRDIRGVSGNVWDDGDPTRLWGYYDSTGAYGSTITFESVGGPQIVVGS